MANLYTTGPSHKRRLDILLRVSVYFCGRAVCPQFPPAPVQKRPESALRFVTQQLLGASVQVCKAPSSAETGESSPLLTSIQQVDPVCHRVFPSRRPRPAATAGLAPPSVAPGEKVQLCEVGDEAARSFFLAPAEQRSNEKSPEDPETSARPSDAEDKSGFLTVLGGSVVCRESPEGWKEGEQQQKALQYFDQRAAVRPGDYDLNRLFSPSKLLILRVVAGRGCTLAPGDFEQ